MSIAQIVLSDLHLGARDSLLTHVNAASEIIDGPSRVLSAFADPEDGVAYAWITNQLGTGKWDDPREKIVRDAFYACLEMNA